ncbi:MAG: CPBP family intramembrane metalloprotease [Anaerolineae bacterium]|nr:CPBP family intramembrane metalloprotease [Anaerolineae bacterium]
MSSTTIGVTPKPYDWRILAILVAAILVSVILVTPYTLSLQAATLKNTPLPLPLSILLPIQWIQTTILYGILAAIGLWVAGRIGLGLPFLESWLAGRPAWERVRRFVGPAMLAGALAGVAILVLDGVVFAGPLQAEIQRLGLNTSEAPALAAPAWQGFLASFYGGITEEILLRLFVLSLLAWLGGFVSHTADGRPSLAVLWIANILAAILFGLGHLPATAAAGLPLDALVITRAVLLNGLGGLVFGWFYWTFGLEAAMVSHFTADIVLHVIAPLLAGR